MAEDAAGVFDALDMDRVHQALKTLDANTSEHNVTFRGDLLMETAAGNELAIPVGYSDAADPAGHFVVLSPGGDSIRVVGRG